MDDQGFPEDPAADLLTRNIYQLEHDNDRIREKIDEAEAYIFQDRKMLTRNLRLIESLKASLAALGAAKSKP